MAYAPSLVAPGEPFNPALHFCYFKRGPEVGARRQVMRTPSGTNRRGATREGLTFEFHIISLRSPVNAAAAAAATLLGSPNDADVGLPSATSAPRTRDAATQSDYRDSESQTQPWTPPHVLPAGAATPNALLLAPLHAGGPSGFNLPAGAAEMATIAALYAKAELHARYEALRGDDSVSAATRQAAMEAVELAVHGAREADLEAESDARLAAIEAQYAARTATRELSLQLRVAALATALETEKQRSAAAEAARMLKFSRKLERARTEQSRQVDVLTKTGSCVGIVSSFSGGGGGSGTGAALDVGGGGGPKRNAVMPQPIRDIIADYSDHSSTVYAPLRRSGGTQSRPPPPIARSGDAQHKH